MPDRGAASSAPASMVKRREKANETAKRALRSARRTLGSEIVRKEKNKLEYTRMECVCEKREHVNGNYRKEVKVSERRRREALRMIWPSRSQVQPKRQLKRRLCVPIWDNKLGQMFCVSTRESARACRIAVAPARSDARSTLRIQLSFSKNPFQEMQRPRGRRGGTRGRRLAVRCWLHTGHLLGRSSTSTARVGSCIMPQSTESSAAAYSSHRSSSPVTARQVSVCRTGMEVLSGSASARLLLRRARGLPSDMRGAS